MGPREHSLRGVRPGPWPIAQSGGKTGVDPGSQVWYTEPRLRGAHADKKKKGSEARKVEAPTRIWRPKEALNDNW